ncbi:nuclear transport factor 2 family protein [Flavobacterium rivuli]|uniref:nuclear transport factor 2 family protein n=1 Tax=Flavobacterium rivuli TaxID=498301 RepID=UPI00036098AF|nr:nuclear transport factor 2 family protein [Flavobacterium rivuli]
MEKKDIAVIEQHFATWSERNEKIRTANIAKVYADDVNIIDPHFVANGHGELNTLIANLQAKFPDYKFTLRKPIEQHHNVARLYWQLGSETKPDAETGMDVITVENGVIKTLIVFIDPQE